MLVSLEQHHFRSKMRFVREVEDSIFVASFSKLFFASMRDGKANLCFSLCSSRGFIISGSGYIVILNRKCNFLLGLQRKEGIVAF
uniref:Clathrin/coatomer adaptor adaptin-like N-terminal domain-containing protein n=1 Tax=Parascaris univalens TaxID=6257 RepID=A0A914ZM44_PARUN